MLSRKVGVAILLVVLFTANTGLAERVHEYVITVGKDPGQYDYTSINAAIVAMNAKVPPLDEDTLGKIEVYEGVYVEQLNNYYDPCNNLPAYCDLVGGEGGERREAQKVLT